MSSIVDALYELKYNPFEYGTYISSFYNSVGTSENNILLAPLVIPLCSHSILGRKLYKSNIKSTIWSIFDDRTMLYDLQERIDEFQHLTEQCIDYCLTNDWLSIDEERLSLVACSDACTLFKIQKGPEKLGRLFFGRSVIEIYAFLGVKPR
ncbi:three component ABC system middle component [Chromobacterium violaceum]|uniref:three component ABC system middle component n=1 Tax=Chromobacterium violaceum TaxID=536 RepID=UPI0009BA6B14|nr:three component ABC system middle component [Chromobacterium violaceum]